MKSTNQSNKSRSRAVSVVICAILIICALLSFVLRFPTVVPSADEQPTAKTENGIRFVQVAAGKDFAIGLTFDGDLYGWSLNENQQGGDTGSALTSTLGTYYSSTPTKIDFQFVRGPQKSGETITKWGESDGSLNTDYHAPRTDDRIKKIVATRSTAAFITEKGYIYTWGKDIYAHDNTVDTDEGVWSSDILGSQAHYLLLRPTDSTNTPWYRPYIINYSYYGDSDPMLYVVPDETVNLKVPDIAASEYGYIILYTNDTGSFTYAWGSLMYSALNAQFYPSYEYTSSDNYGTSDYMHGDGQRRIVNVGISGNTVKSVVAGGYNFGINRTKVVGTSNVTSLQVRGRNFLTSRYDATYDEAKKNNGFIQTMSVVTSESANALSDIKYAAQTPNPGNAGVVSGLIVGNNGESLPGVVESEKVHIQRYYGILTSNGNLAFKDTRSANVYDAHNNALTKIGETEENAYTTELFGVALGNDVGYGIADDGDDKGCLYAWGDNAYGQLASAPADGNYNKTIPTKILSGVNGFVSVAAGKQLSAANKAFNSVTSLTAGVLEGGSDTIITGFNDNVKNSPDFISGAITDDGKLYVWSNNAPAPQQITYGDVAVNGVQSTDRFVAVYSGYGNNIFAITQIGKLIRLEYKGGKYVQTRYDNFVGVTNWTLDNTNTVAFAPVATPTAENTAPDLGTATFYVWNAATVANGEQAPTLGSVTFNGGGENGVYKPLVQTNAIGDVYRIMGVSGDDGKLPVEGSSDGAFLSAVAAADKTSTFAPVFKYGTGSDIGTYTEMTEQQQKNMFDVSFVRDADGVGIRIKPIKSSKGYTIVMEFYVARYNSEVNFNAEKDDALYYDYKKCVLRFTIADTPTVKTYEAFDADNGNKSNIPLLDPNNEYNRFYSVAVQNVSLGIQKISDYFENAGMVSTIVGQIDTDDKDPGFPAVRKRTAGDLDYYLGQSVAEDKYGGVYQYLFEDRDADRVIIKETDGGMMEGASTSGAIIGKVRTVRVAGVDTGRTVGNGVTVETVARDFARDFDNVFGIYNVQFAENTVGEVGHITISFSYDIILFEATASSGALQYAETNGVADYLTVQNSDARVDASILAETHATAYNAAYGNLDGTKYDIPVASTLSIVKVYSQASLRVSKNSAGAELEAENRVGGRSGENKYKETITSHPDNPSRPIVIGDAVTVDLTKFFTSRSTRMVFSYNNKANSDSYTAFNNLFFDETGSGTQIVALNDTRLVVRPTTAEPISLTVTAQRFSSSDDYGAVFAGENERIDMTFVFTNIVDFALERVERDTTFLVTTQQTIDIIGESKFLNVSNTEGGSGITTEKAAELLSKIVITTPQASASDKFTVVKTPGSNTAITITPKASGTGTVRFSATLYGKNMSFEITVNVRKLTLFGDASDLITVVDDQYIYVDAIKTKLAKSNEFGNGDSIDGYNILTGDVVDNTVSDSNKVYNAIYFTDTVDGAPVERPSFIRNVVFEGLTGDKPNIRIIANNSSVEANVDYYMHIKFTNANVSDYASAPDGSVIEAVYVVRSGKIKIPVSVNIDCKNIANSSAENITLTTSGEGLNAVVFIPVSQLLERAEIESPSQYSIVIIRSDSTTANYFNYATANAQKDIRIEPVNNTPDVTDRENNPYGPELEVSVSNASGSSYLILTFNVSVSGILTVLPVMQGDDGVIGYGNIWIYSTLIVFGVLAIIFIIRFIVYWRKRSKQRAIIKRNQELIRLRDRIHAKGTSATREQVVKTRLKMDDPKYAKMMHEMRKSRQEENGGVILENADIAATAVDPKSKKKKKKKGGKKTVAELKAELEAKKAAFAAAQSQNAAPVDPFMQDVPMDGGFETPEQDFDNPDGGFSAAPDDFGGAQSIDGSEIIFDATDMGDGM